MKSSASSQAFVQYIFSARKVLGAFAQTVLSRGRQSVTVEWLALIIAWLAVMAIGLAVVGSLLGEG